MTIFRFRIGLTSLSASLFISTALAAPSSAGWVYQDQLSHQRKAVQARLRSQDGSAVLVIRCDISGDRTISIQYKPSDYVGLSMAPVTLDWFPGRTETLSSRLVWEPDRSGAFARDGEEDRHASAVAESIQGSEGLLKITASDRWGDPVETTYDNSSNRDVIGRVLKDCPWHPETRER